MRGLKFGKGGMQEGGCSHQNKPRREQEPGGSPLAHRLLPNFHRPQEPGSPRSEAERRLEPPQKLEAASARSWDVAPTTRCRCRSCPAVPAPVPAPRAGRGTKDLGGDLAPPSPGSPAPSRFGFWVYFYLFIFFFIIFFPRDPRVEVAPGPTRCDGRWSRGHAAPRASQRGAVPGSGACCGAKHRDAAVPRQAGF